MQFRYGMFMNFWENSWKADFVKYIKKCQALGFDVLEFQAQSLLEMSDDEIRALRRVADEHGIELTYSLGLDKKYDIASLDEETQKRGVEYLSAIIEKVHVAGGRIISGVSYAGWGVPDVVDVERATENSIKNMKILSKKAEEYGITYGIEAVNRFEGVVINTAKQARAYVDRVGSKNVGVLLDTYHMNIEEDSIADAIRTAGDKLVGFHVGENNRTVPGNGYGHINWKEIFDALKEVDYQGRIVAEPFIKSGGEVGNAIFVWRDLVENATEEVRDAQAANMLKFFKELER